MVSMVRAGTGPSWLVMIVMRNLGTYLEKIGSWRLRLAPNQDLSGSQDHLEGTAQLHLPTCLLSTKVVPHLLWKFYLTITYLYHLWPVERDGVLIAEERFKSLPSMPMPDWPPIWREDVFDRIFSSEKIAGYSCLWLERIIPYIRMCRCIAASAQLFQQM